MALTAWQSAVAYVIEGIVIVIGNLLIILAILIRKALRARKELLIIASLSFGDMVWGMAFLSVGLYRLDLYGTPATQWANYTSLDCTFRTPTATFWYGGETMCIMMMVVSIDRLIAVVKPGLYFSLTPRYVMLLSAIVYLGYGPATVAASVIVSYLRAKAEGAIHSPICYGTWAVSPGYYMYDVGMQMVLSLGACLMYGGVILVLWVRNRRLIAAGGENTSSAQAKMLAQSQRRQDRVTRILGFVVLSTLFFFTIPCLVMGLTVLFDVTLGEHYGWISLLSWVVSGVNSMFNVTIYISRHPDIRSSVGSMLFGWSLAKWVGASTTVQPVAISSSHPTAKY